MSQIQVKPKLDSDALKGVDWTLGAPALEFGTWVRTHTLASVLRGDTPSSETVIPVPEDPKKLVLNYDDPIWKTYPRDYKTIWLWPYETRAIVLGPVKKGIGYIWGASYGWDGDGEPGGFDPRAYVPLLYLALGGRTFAYAPYWGVIPE